MVTTQTVQTNTLSTFRTRHRFLHFGEFKSVEEFISFRCWAREHGHKLYILGNGSNTLFASKTVHALVLRNRLEPRLEFLDECHVAVSSSVSIMAVLKECHARHLDSFYYLASAPATIGGAIAMNAGRGRGYNMAIFDFLESVSYVGDEGVVTVPSESIEHSHRWTAFTGIHDRLIVSAVLRFPAGHYEGDPIADRIAYAKDVQDTSAPNCGSVFKECYGRLQVKLRGLRFGGACFSPKTSNWILNRGNSPYPIRTLISISKCLHRLLGKRAVLELVEVR